ncbi:MAG: hypothetical protein KAG53_11435 [Endozoicomonadaceae bacterium]|nr:hypothetical protein [Endozoicomonadaceae bacterium]
MRELSTFIIKGSTKKRTGSLEPKCRMIGRVSIDQRPAIVDEKMRRGNREANTVIDKDHKGVLLTLTEQL